MTDSPRGNRVWPGWRGSRRDGVVDWLPERLPDSATFFFSTLLPGEGVGGLAVNEDLVILGCRDHLDRHDVWLVIDAESGLVLSQLIHAAAGRLDYGNSARATPLIDQSRAYFFSAFGRLTCLNLERLQPDWQRDLGLEYHTPPLDWGVCGSPVMVDGLLVVQPGGLKANIVGLDPITGATVWESAGGKPGHSSLLPVSVGESTQLIGYDAKSLGGWDARTGARLWTILPPRAGDFNVPTPIATQDGFIVTTENNGTRRYRFQEGGRLAPQPVAANEELNPDSHTPVLANGRLYGVGNGLYCLDAETLQTIWHWDDDALYDYASVIISEKRLLLFTRDGELILMEDTGTQPRLLGRLKLIQDGGQTLSHPALVGTKFYARLGERLICLELSLSP